MSVILDFGKYKGSNIRDIYEKDFSYCIWLFKQPITKTKDELYKYLESKIKDPDAYYLSWGKYKNYSLDDIAKIDEKYINWLKSSDYVLKNCPKLKDELSKY
jgi:uncharacterized protein (DUF3820 family)